MDSQECQDQSETPEMMVFQDQLDVQELQDHQDKTDSQDFQDKRESQLNSSLDQDHQDTQD